MPELPEVESFARALSPLLEQKAILGMTLFRAGLRYPFPEPQLRQIFSPGARFVSVYRRGKQLCLETDRGVVRVSLGMTGRFLIRHVDDAPLKHEHVRIGFGHAMALSFEDPRRFGFWLTQPDHRLEKALDPLEEQNVQAVLLSERAFNDGRPIKTVLLDQTLLGGVGNIYALEALFKSGVLPQRPCSSLTERERVKLARALSGVLKEAVSCGGSTIATFKQLHGQRGGYQQHHKVYARHGQPCTRPRCTGHVTRTLLGGRGTWFCPVCQK